jgi:hypothetical protein
VKLGPATHLYTWSTHIEAGVEEAIAVADAGATVLSAGASAFLERIRKPAYAQGTPSYLQRQKNVSSLAGLLRRAVEQPRRIAEWRTVRGLAMRLRRARLRRVYNGLASGLPTCAFAAVFLHLQPERTTVPEGGRFAVQTRLIDAVAARVPGLLVGVREHPSTFMAGAQLRRDAAFYLRLCEREKVRLISLDISPFQVIDAAKFIATVTGSVAFEAVARGRPAIVFGAAPYDGCEGIFRVRNNADIDAAIVGALQPVAEGAADRFLARFESSPRVYVGPREAALAHVQHWRSGLAHAEVFRLIVKELRRG